MSQPYVCFAAFVAIDSVVAFEKQNDLFIAIPICNTTSHEWASEFERERSEIFEIQMKIY